MQPYERKPLCEFIIIIIIIIIIIGGMGLSPLGTAATSGLLYKPQMIDEDDCGAIGGMKIGRENRSTRRKPAPAPLCPPQIPHDQVRFRTPSHRGEKPATNRLSYGTAPCVSLVYRRMHTGISEICTLSIVRYSKEHNVSETASISVLRLRPFKIANLNHWTT
jgi:hypothetical protein